MRVVHANWSAETGRLLVWGEDSTLPPRAPRPPGRRPRVARLRPHPFACSAELLHDAAAALGCPVVDAGEPRQLILLLPSDRDGPRSSPGLLRDQPAAPEAPTGLAPWSVPALALAPDEALDLLLALPPGSPPEVVAGSSLRVLAEVANLAIEGLAQGRVVPVLTARNGRWLAHWRPSMPDRSVRRLALAQERDRMGNYSFQKTILLQSGLRPQEPAGRRRSQQ